MKRLEFKARIGILAGIFLQPMAPLIADFQAAFLHDNIGINGAVAEKIAIYSCLGAGVALLVWGCSCLARSKGYHWSLGLLGIFSCIGVLVIALFPSKEGVVSGSLQHDLIRYHRDAVLAITISTLAALAVWPTFRIIVEKDPHTALAYIEPYRNLYPAVLYSAIPACIGFITSLIGSFYVAKSKGYGAIWSFAGVFSLIGWFLLFLIPDRNREEIPEPNRSFRNLAQFVGFFMVLGAIYTAIDFPMGISEVRVFRDRVAAQNMASLGKALTKFSEERVRCDVRVSASENLIKYMVGPYYGWSGTNRDVRVWINKDEVHGCALSGTHPAGANTRYVYRIKFSSGSALPAVYGQAALEGRAYGRPGETCYTDTLVGTDCRIRKPSGVPCK